MCFFQNHKEFQDSIMNSTEHCGPAYVQGITFQKCDLFPNPCVLTVLHGNLSVYLEKAISTPHEYNEVRIDNI
jgi:hypothetical protein